MSPRDTVARAVYLSQVHEAFLTDPEQNRLGLPAGSRTTKGEHGPNLYNETQRSGGVADA